MNQGGFASGMGVSNDNNRIKINKFFRIMSLRVSNDQLSANQNLWATQLSTMDSPSRLG